MIYVSKSTKVYIVLIAILTFIIVKSALVNRLEFDQVNVPVYDGVLYEFQQLKRFQKFEGDFGLKNRISQTVYEYQGNPVGGLYTSFLTFFAPSFLQNNTDIFLRSFVGFFLFALSFFLIFRKKYSDFWAFSLLLLFSQLPILYNYRIGLGSYTPELIGAVYLLAGYLFLYLFVKEKRFIYFLMGFLCFLFPLAFRFNFFAYAFLLSLPIVILFIKEFKNFSKKLLWNLLFLGVAILSVFFINFFYHFTAFYNYYTTVCYAIGNLESSFMFFKQNLQEFYSYNYPFVFIIALVGNQLFRNKEEIKWIPNYLISLVFLYPFIVYSIFVLFVMNSTNTPHIMSISLFFGFLFIPIFKFPFNHKISKSLKFVLGFLLVFCTLTMFCFTHYIKPHIKKDKYYEAQRFTINYIKKNKVKSMFNCYDAMLDIPINTALYNDQKIMIPYTGSFVTNDIYLQFSCKSYDACLAQYVSQLEQADLIVINAKETDPYILPMAKKIRSVLREKLATVKSHKLVLRKNFKFYGPVLFYRMR
ncbi:MAG: hypothetical protein ACK48V_06860 [Crocinitomicaceae bacterium]